MQGLNFIAIDFETATGRRASICEAGICVVRDGRVAETRSWLVRPQGNCYSYWNIQIHGIHPEDTAGAPEFPEVWSEISAYLKDCPVLVAHNAAFDMGCIRHSLEGLPPLGQVKLPSSCKTTRSSSFRDSRLRPVGVIRMPSSQRRLIFPPEPLTIPLAWIR